MFWSTHEMDYHHSKLKEFHDAILSLDLGSLKHLLEQLEVPQAKIKKQDYGCELLAVAVKAKAPIAFCDLILSYFKPCGNVLNHYIYDVLSSYDAFKPDLVELLLKHEANLSDLFLAAVWHLKSLEVIEMFLKRGVDIDMYLSDGDTPLLIAIGDGNVHVTLYLIQNGADVNKGRDLDPSTGASWSNPLLSAVADPDPATASELIVALVEHGAYLDPICPRGYTPLIAFLRNRLLLEQLYCIAYKLIKWGCITVLSENVPLLLETVQTCLIEEPDFELIRLLYVSGMDVGQLKFELNNHLPANPASQSVAKLPDFLVQCRTQPRTLRGLSCIVVRHTLYCARDGRCISASVDALEVPFTVKSLLHLEE